MRGSLLAVVAAVAAAPPIHGVLVPGQSLGGVRLGATPAQVERAWGKRHGVCRSCRQTTWYFNFRRFEPQGAGVEFRRGRVAAIFTLWAPEGWRTNRGLRIGNNAARITEVYGPLPRVECKGYAALTLRTGRSRTIFYVLGEELWGFGLLARGVPVCR